MRFSPGTLFVLLLAFSPVVLSAEPPSAGMRLHSVFVSGGRHYVHAHHQSLNHLTRGPFPVFQAGIHLQTTGMVNWHHVYNFPDEL